MQVLHLPDENIPALQVRDLKHRAVKLLAQGHTVGAWETPNLHLRRLSRKPALYPTMQ